MLAAAGFFLALIALAAGFRLRLLAALGLELRRIEPQPLAQGELAAAACADGEGGTAKQDRDRKGALLDLHDLEVSDVMIHRA